MSSGTISTIEAETSATHHPDAPIERLAVAAYSIPTDAPEADGTCQWDKTVLVLVEITADGITGLGYTYADAATAQFVRDHLAPLVLNREAYEAPAVATAMAKKIRNLGRPGISSMAISAVDAALWDLNARLLNRPLVAVLGAARAEAPIYGSGGFTSYSIARLQEQLGGWAGEGIPRVKMKIGSNPKQDFRRVKEARKAIGDGTELFVDANGAYDLKEALTFACQFAAVGVTWFEEPVSSDDLDGLRRIRDRGPTSVEIAAGEYGYDLLYFRRMLSAGAVDVLQADASRCGGVTGFLKSAALCESFGLPFSAHCAPALHLHPCCAVTADFRHLEYFHDHSRIETMLFDGAVTPVAGALRPDLSRPGMGLDFKHQDAKRFQVWAAETATA